MDRKENGFLLIMQILSQTRDEPSESMDKTPISSSFQPKFDHGMGHMTKERLFMHKLRHFTLKDCGSGQLDCFQHLWLFACKTQLSRLKVKKTEWWVCPKMSSISLPVGGMTPKSEITAECRIYKFISAVTASSYGITRETESKNIDPSPQKSMADHPEPEQI
ncbi:hypothetical protein WISP_120848 [Willisornis vidua]|uniref:Uncharacterized protein n=1 Tax=Willisornis vidua TaxID=1566151 RepID=A0ABQ9CXP8_9PASS|nr:hypothetical protein WISP_120848 [Willisornis vidua]